MRMAACSILIVALPGARPERWYLDAATGSMNPVTSAAAPAEKSYPGLGDGLTFTSAPFTEDTEVTGPIGRLWVTSTTADTDIFAALRLIQPQGGDFTFTRNRDTNVPLGLGYLRVSHRAVDSARSTKFAPLHRI